MDVVDVDGGLRIAMTTESSSSDSRSRRISGLKISSLGSIFRWKRVLARFAEEFEWGSTSETLFSSRWRSLRLSFPSFLNEEYSDGVKVGETLIWQSMCQIG